MPKPAMLPLLVAVYVGWTVASSTSAAEPAPGGKALESGTLCLIDDGRAPARVVIPAGNNETAMALAQLLCDYIEKSTHVRLPIVSEPADGGSARIYLGDTLYARRLRPAAGTLDADGYILAFPEPDCMIIAGGSDWGTEFGVYEFLERYLGVRWLFPGDLGEEVPECRTLTVPAAEVREEPAFFSRIIVGTKMYDRDTRLVGGGRTSDTQKWVFRSRQHSRIEFHHNLWSLFAPSVYGKTHPEFYPLRFEPPTRAWEVNGGEGSGKTEFSVTTEARHGEGALKVTFLPWRQNEKFSGIVTKKPGIDGGWAAYGKFQGIRFWFRGDGSGTKIIFSIAANGWKENYVSTLSLDNQDWQYVSIPWNTLTSGETAFDPLAMHALSFGINSYLGGTSPCPGCTFWLDDIELFTAEQNGQACTVYSFEKDKNDTGTRFIPDNDECKYEPWWNPCFTAPGLAEEAIRRISEFFVSYPAEASYSLGINDGGGLCECANCQVRIGGRTNYLGQSDLSELYYEWVNRVATGVLAKTPDKYVGLLAYDSVIEPPTQVKLDPHIVPFITYDRMKWADPVLREEGHRLTQAWAKASPTLGWYDYIFGRTYIMPRVYFHQMADTLKFAHENGARAYFAEAWILGVPKDWIEGPKLYLTMKLLWDPYLDVDATLTDWYESAVGKEAAPHLAAYFAHLEDFWTRRIPQSAWFKANGKSIYLNFQDHGYLAEVTAADLATCAELLRRTVAAAGTTNQQQRAGMFLSTFGEWSTRASQR